MRRTQVSRAFIFLRDEIIPLAKIQSAASSHGLSLGDGLLSESVTHSQGNRNTSVDPNRPWQRWYPKGMAHDIDVRPRRSIADVIEATCAKFGSNPCFSNFGYTMSFAEIDRASQDFAAFLQGIEGLQPGDRIAIQLPNLLQFPIAAYGALRAGMVVVNTNPLYTPREMANQFKDSGAKAIVICANFAKNLEEVLPQTDIRTVIVTEVGDSLPFAKRFVVNSVLKYVKKMVPAYSIPKAISFRDALIEGQRRGFRKVELSPQSVAFLQYTGGTTGISKGAVLTHANIVANMEQVAAVLTTCLEEGKEICVTPLPLYHVFSLTVNSLALFQFGVHNVLITNPRDIGGFIKELKKYRFSVMTGVNTLFNALLNHPEFKSVDCSSLKFSVAGAMALQKPVLERWEEVTRSVLLEGYGLTESAPVVSVNPPVGERRVGTVGLPLPSIDVQIRDEQGRSVPFGEVGEVCVHGPQVMQGYWNKPEETAKVLTVDRWLHTGDMGMLTPDGYLKIVDRQKDMITVSGFKVYPNEVEEVLASHPGIVEAGVIGIPDPHSGEVVKAFVVRRDPGLKVEDVIEFARKNLTAYKIPRSIEFRDSLPKSNVGKILRRELR